MTHAYTEDQLVEQPAIGLFAELGWSTVSALEETFGPTGTLSRETKGDVVLVSRLRAAKVRSIPALSPEKLTGSSSGIHTVSTACDMTIPLETAATTLLGISFERLVVSLRKSFVFNKFLFEWKTS